MEASTRFICMPCMHVCLCPLCAGPNPPPPTLEPSLFMWWPHTGRLCKAPSKGVRGSAQVQCEIKHTKQHSWHTLH
eukprot:1499532-Rhodomonas_salina.5